MHTHGPGCHLAPVPQPRLDAWLESIPPSNAQFFYASIVPIDDPLSAPSGDSKPPKLPLRPFSQADSNRLEVTWLQLFSDIDRENHDAAWRHCNPGPRLSQSNEDTLDIVVRNLTARHRLKHLQEAAPEHDAVTTVRATLQGAATSIPVCCDQLFTDARVELQALFCPLAVQHCAALSVDKMTQRVMVALNYARKNRTEPNSLLASSAIQPSMASPAASNSALPQIQQPGSLLSPNSAPGPASIDNQVTLSPNRDVAEAVDDSISHPAALPTAVTLPHRLPVPDDGISGKPFLRADMPSGPLRSSTSLSPLSRASEVEHPGSAAALAAVSNNGDHSEIQFMYSSSPSRQPRESLSASDENYHTKKETLRHQIQSSSSLLDRLRKSFEVAVGISRLHTVDLPALQMKPIYWSPVHDISAVQRATWFYRDTMMPLEATVANQLESLYRELRPWSETWEIELRCAIDIGPIGEEKVSQPLWPPTAQNKTRTRADIAHPEPKISSDPYCASHCYQGAAAAVGTAGPPATSDSGRTTTSGSIGPTSLSPTAERSFANYHAIFKDGTAAFLLKPSLKPSAYYGRRPITKICKGATVGIPIVRGFDRSAWNRIHNQSPSGSMSEGFQAPAALAPAAVAEDIPDRQEGHSVCPGCRADKSGSLVSDLVLVIHGVGQKLAERVESFHFTHAVNGLRRAMSAELKTPLVQSILRDGHNGIMVLPVNWRHTLSFEDGGFSENSGQETTGGFELKDIEQTSIPAVRSMISDVMFDIPFYMSHHKPKMILSLVREANRVYRLWCQNNPGFSETGRVHLIGHSLGSAMAIEVLSKQPTIPPRVGPDRMRPETSFFEFDTKNLFLLGSPAAFFLLLERGTLVPRRGRQKAGVDTRDSIDSRVVGEAGAFGCLAVDNIYNVLAKEDPIAYLLNGTIDTAYAASLKAAYVPSATVGFFASISHSLKSMISGAPTTPHPVDISLSVSALPSIVRLPSQLELEVHDFTREEIAEHKAYLLNDNGQIDYFLQSGGGPLEIQYLNMLSAHTSYWTNHDLIRMLCVEIGRRPGKDDAVPAMRAVKSLKRVVPNIGHT